MILYEWYAQQSMWPQATLVMAKLAQGPKTQIIKRHNYFCCAIASAQSIAGGMGIGSGVGFNDLNGEDVLELQDLLDIAIIQVSESA